MPIGKPAIGQCGFNCPGFTYLGLLMFIAISGILLAVIGQVWHVEAQREKERELLFIGEQFRSAIGSYYRTSPSDPKQYPLTLQDLLVDQRFPVERHHLRKIYREPFTGRAEWGLIKDQGRIVGIHSLSDIKPLKQAGFSGQQDNFNHAENYQRWLFVYGRDGIAATTADATQSFPVSSTDNSAVSTTENKPQPVASEKPKDGYENCGKQLDGAYANCHSSCGDFTGSACRSCMNNAFAQYRACI